MVLKILFCVRFSPEMVTQACAKFKLSKRQVRRVYEILRLRATNTSDKTAYLEYRLDVKNRLNAPFQVNNYHRTTFTDINRLFLPSAPDLILFRVNLSHVRENYTISRNKKPEEGSRFQIITIIC